MARFEGGTVVFETTWTAVKEQIDNRSLDFRFEEDSTAYQIFAVDDSFIYSTIIYKSGQAPENQATYDAWRADFEANYKNRVVDYNSTSAVFISNIDGYSVVLKDGATPTANDGYGIALIGYDGSNYRMNRMDSSGRQIVIGAGVAGTPAGGVISIQGVSGGQPIPVSGTVTATNPSVGSNDTTAPTSSTLIGGTDGTNLRATRIFDLDTGGGQQWVLGVGLRKAAGGGSVELGTSSDPIRIDPVGTTTQPVSGTVTANQGGSWTVAATQSGTWTVQPGNTANTTPWLTTISQGGNSATVTASNALKIDGSAVTQPVSGTVTANAGTGNFTVVQATASNLRAQLASESSTGVAIPSTALMVAGSDGTLLRSLFVDSSGRQFVIGAAANGAAVVGNPVLIAGSDGTNARSIRTATDGTIRIDPTGTTTQPVSGTVTANQGGTWTVQPGNTANTTPWLATISQGGNSAVVKAASTAAVATDPALVVAISPNNSVSVTTTTSDTTGAGTLNALNATASVVLAGKKSVGMFLAAGTLVGTIVPELSMDGGTTWVATFFDDPATGNKASSIVFGVANTATTRTIIGAGGASHARVRVSAYTSGSAACTLRATEVGDPSHLFTGSNGSTVLPPLSGLIAGSDGSVLRSLLTDTSGRPMIVGAHAAGIGPTSNPVLIGGTTGSVVRSVLTDNIGRLIVSPSFEASSGSISLLGVSYGYISLATNALNAVRATTYNEQSSNAQRSMSSSSSVDTAAGIGARTVRITYYTSTYTGPFTTTVTLNGTTPVNTSVSDICFVEKMEVVTVGSALFPAGTITLFVSTGGAGGTIGTITATDGRTLWAHHYVALAKTCFVTNINASNNSNQAMQFTLKYRPSGSNQFELQQDWIRPPVGSIGGAFQRHYNPPFKFVGPGRIVAYVKPDQAVTAVYHCSFDYYEE